MSVKTALKLTPKVKLALGGALVLAAFIYVQRRSGNGLIGISVECDPTNPGSCSGGAASGGDLFPSVPIF